MARAKKKSKAPAIGSIGWHDLTVKAAPKVRDFYAKVVGWKTGAIDMGGYEDFTMHEPASGECVAGVCHARGANSDLPPQWMMYVIVADVARAARIAVKHGGKVVVKPRAVMGGRFCVVRDPAGAVCGLYQAPKPAKS